MIVKGLEDFIIAFHGTHEAFQLSRALLHSGDVPGARDALTGCQPETVLEDFARFSSLGGMTRGEQGLLVSLNLRWFSHILRQRQVIGLEPIQIDFAPTRHEDLAQNPGKYTFHFGPDRRVWECWGNAETGAQAVALPAGTRLRRAAGIPATWEEICATSIESDRPLTLLLHPIMGREGRDNSVPAKLPPGRFRLHLLMCDPVSRASNRRVFEVVINGESGSRVADRVDIFSLAAQAGKIVERVYNVEVGDAEEVQLTFKPLLGRVRVCGAMLRPLSILSGEAGAGGK